MPWVLVTGPVMADKPAFNSGVMTQNALGYVPGVESLAPVELPAVNVTAANIGPAPAAPAFPGQVHIQESHHGDFHFRLYTIPAVLNLTNPRLGSEIPFTLWNTFRQPATLVSIDTGTSNALEFTIDPGYVIRDSELSEQALVINPGEPDINTVVSFDFGLGTAELQVIAALSTTFDLEYDVPVKETWQYLTETLVAYDNTEQRISLRRNPRRTLSFTVDPVTLKERIRQGSLLFSAMPIETQVPYFQYSVSPTQTALEGSSKIFLDPSRGAFQLGSFALALNPDTLDVFIGRIDLIEADGLTFGATLNVDIDPDFIVAPMVPSTLDDGAGFRNLSVSSSIAVTARSLAETPLTRSDDVTSLVTQYDGFPVLLERPLRGADEEYLYEREVIDNETGKRFIESAWPVPIIQGKRTYFVQRNARPEQMDFWRQFFDQIKGAHKAFLTPTWLPDLTVSQPVTSGSAVIAVSETEYEAQYFEQETFKRLYLQFSDGTPPQTVTAASASVIQETGEVLIGLESVLPDTNPGGELALETISYLNLVTATDTVNLEHTQQNTKISFAIKQVGG